MPRTPTLRRKTIPWSRIATIAGGLVASLPLVPALLINVDMAGGLGWGWTLAAGGSILMAAVFADASRRTRQLRYLLASMLLVAINCIIAFDNAAHRSDHRSDHRTNTKKAAEDAQSLRSQHGRSRSDQVKVAAERAVETYKSDIQAAIAEDAKRWTATGQCDALTPPGERSQITAGPSMTYCSGIAKLRAKMAPSGGCWKPASLNEGQRRGSDRLSAVCKSAVSH